MARRGYSKKKKCPGCGKPISNQAEKCNSCAKKANEAKLRPPLMAWRYDCPCGIRAYSFDPLPEIRDSAGHEIRRGARAIYNNGKLYDYCPACGTSGGAHSCERRDEVFYVACCPR